MYMVVSFWEANPGMEEQFENESRPMRDMLSSQPGVVMVHGFKSDGKYVAIHGYEDEAAYRRIIQDENGPFNKALREHRIEDYARWVGSERGETTD